VLACLLLDLGRNVPSDSIVDAVWGERPPSGVQTTLQTYVFRLREALEPRRGKGDAPTVLVTVPGGYRLESAAVRVDAARFEALVAAGRTALATDPATAAAHLGEGLALWRGDVLADLPALDGVVAPVSGRLNDLRFVATELWVEAELALGHTNVLSTLDEMVARHPLREHLAALRMLALYRAGRQADALAAYRQLRRVLDDDLGIQPSGEVESLHQRILQQDPSLDLVLPTAPDLPAPATSPTGPTGPTEAMAPVGKPRSLRRGISLRGWAAITAVVLVAVAALVVTTFHVRRADVMPLPPNSVGPVDARGLRGDATQMKSAPTALVAAGDVLWAVQGDADAVVRIDPQTREVTQTINGIGRVPQAISSSGDDLWVAASDEKVVTRVDVATARPGNKIAVGSEPVAVVATPGGVWVANSGDNTVQRIDPATERVDPPIPVGDGPDALALDGSTLWVANGRSGTVSQVDTRTGHFGAADIRVGAGPAALAVTPTDVWVANEFDQSVSRIVKSTAEVQAHRCG
jgi:YVTN family beta-propeller protein